MNFFKELIKGDKYLWAFIGLLAVFSFLPVYSASSNLVYTVGKGSVISHMGKHAIFLIVGMLIIVGIQKVNYKYFGGFAFIAVIISAALLAYTLLQGKTIDGANASRWITLPGTSVTIQTSTFASMALLIYVARYLTKIRDKEVSFGSTILPLFLPMFAIIGLILPANGSTAAILFAMCLVLLFIGGFPIKYLLVIVGTGILAGSAFIYVALNHPEILPSSRVHTWQSRIENFSNDDGIESYQVHHAKAAINRGGLWGVGPGKSVFKQTLPQSSSDFIFAIIVEEYGILGAGGLIFVYLLILFRMTIIATKIHTIFGTLVVCAVGLPVIFQAFINMGVAVSLFPVTGQPLPMISYGGTSLWVTCIAFGIVLSVSRAIMSPEEIKSEERKIQMKLSRTSPKIIISGGGTGGHIYPAIAIADEIKNRFPEAEILFVGALGKMEMEKVPKAGYPIKGLPIEGFDRGNLFSNFKFPFKLIKSLNLAKKIIAEFKPDAAIGTGGYASGPLLWQASKKGIPVVIQEQNSFPGITNKLLKNKAAAICVAYQDISQFPADKTFYTGNPIRSEIFTKLPDKSDAVRSFGLDPDKKTILSIGGSQGSRTLNNAWKAGIGEILKNDVQLIWQTGKLDFENLKREIKNDDSGIHLTEFIYEMKTAFASADLIVSRAGAMAISELCLVGKPVVLVPFPYAAEDHQTKNAKSLADKNAALMMSDAEAAEKLVSTALELIKDEEKQKMLSENIKQLGKPDATKEIVDILMSRIK